MPGSISRRALLRGAAAAAVGIAAAPSRAADTEPRLRPPRGLIRLRANENPYGPGPRALEAAARGMAGMRIGYVMAPPALASVVRDNFISWPNVVGIAAAIASYQDDDFIEFSRRRIIEGRAIINDTFRRNGIEPLPSQANFVYADIGRSADEFAARMRERGVDIREAYPPYATWSRVSAGRLEELQTFSSVFDEVHAGRG